MAKLNQKELKALTIEVEKMIEESKQQFKNSAEFNSFVSKVKKEIRYEDTLLLVKKYMSVEAKREKLTSELNDITKTITDFGTFNVFDAPRNLRNLETQFNKKVTSELCGKYPTTEEIEHKLTLLNLQGSTDLLTLIKTDLGL